MGYSSTSLFRMTGFRADSNRSGTTPAHDWVNYPESLDAIIDRLRGVVLENREAIEVMRTNDTPETLHYVDPPYVFETRTKSSKYPHELQDEDHADLCDFLKTLKGKVILSGYENPIYMEKLKGWRIEKKETYADGAKKRTEILYLNFNDLQTRMS